MKCHGAAMKAGTWRQWIGCQLGSGGQTATAQRAREWCASWRWQFGGEKLREAEVFR